MGSHHNAVIFIQNTHNRHPTAHFDGTALVCLLWVQCQALFQYKDCLSGYGNSHYNDDNTVIIFFIMGIPILIRVHLYNTELSPGGWFNIKMTSYQYRKSHCGDKMILRPSYLHNGISYTGKLTSLHWIRALVCIYLMIKVWFIFYVAHRSVVCNSMSYWTRALIQYKVGFLPV